MAWLPSYQPPLARFWTLSVTVAMSPRRTGLPLGVADDQGAEGVGILQLGRGINDQRLVGGVEAAERAVAVGGGDGRLDLVEAEPLGGQLLGIDVDADRVGAGAEDLGLGDAVDG